MSQQIGTVGMKGVSDTPKRQIKWGAAIGLALLSAVAVLLISGLFPTGNAVLGLVALAGVALVALSVWKAGTTQQQPEAIQPAQPLPVEAEPIAAEVAPATAEPVAQDMSALFEQLIALAPVGIVVVGADGNISQANDAAVAISGGNRDLQGAAFLSLFDDGQEQAARDCFGAVFANREKVPATDLILSGGGERVALVHGGLLTAADDAGEAIFFLIDATEQRSLEAQFAQGQRMQAVGQLAGGVAHDFNNLLTAMIGFADLLLMRHPPGDPSYADIVHIKQNANRAAALVRQLLAFSRRQTLRPKVLNLTDVLTDLSDLLRRLIGEHLNIRIVHERDLGLVRADQGQIEQVVTNLVVNARDAMEAGGTVTIQTNNVSVKAERPAGDTVITPGDYVEIDVTDTGHGISEDNLERIFEPFFTTKSVGEGTGLGLATVYGIVRQTGGFVDVQSEVGVGTSIKILLPRVIDESAREGKAKRRDAVDLTGSGTILLVEDEDAVRLFASRALRNKGYQLIEAESGEVALGIIEERAEEIDLMISDVVMPNMDGPTLIRRARELRPDIKAVFISGYAEEAFRRSLGDDLGDVDLLPKPFSLKQLASKVKDQLEA